MRRGSTVLELLAVLAVIALLISGLLRFNNSLIEDDLKAARARETATRELWMIRMDAPNQDFWMWTDENGIEWLLSGSSNKVIELGESNG